MRLNLRLSGATEPVPFNHLHRLTGALHKWLGANNSLHDEMSLYSFGWLQGARPRNGHLTFPGGAAWRLSFAEPEAARQVIRGILQAPEVTSGMEVFEVQEEATPAFGPFYRFETDGGAILARKERPGGGRAYLLWDDPEADAVLTRVLRHKLKRAGLSGADLAAQVRFDRSYPRPRTRLLEIRGIQHRGSVCPVIVEGTPEAVRLAWLVAVGELTGSGFGALR